MRFWTVSPYVQREKDERSILLLRAGLDKEGAAGGEKVQRAQNEMELEVKRENGTRFWFSQRLHSVSGLTADHWGGRSHRTLGEPPTSGPYA